MKFGKCASACCRFGCNTVENEEHLFFTCPFLKMERDHLKEKFTENNIEYNFRNIFTNLRVQHCVETFISRIIEVD